MNQYIVYMIGKCYYKLNNEEDAGKYFRLAYEYGGTEIFEIDGGEFLKVVNL